MPKYSYLLLDADNTLFDFPAGEACALRQLFEEFSLPSDSETLALYHRINDELWEALERGEVRSEYLRVERFQRLLRMLGDPRDAEPLSNRYLLALAEYPLLLPGAEDAVRRWAKRVPMAIVTNGIGLAQRGRIARSTIGAYLPTLIISEEIGAAKPDPSMVWAAMQALGCNDPTKALLVGDSLQADIAAAHRAGIDSCWFNPTCAPNPTPFQPTYTIAALDMVDALLA